MSNRRQSSQIREQFDNFACPICLMEYDDVKVPMVICNNMHIICDKCVDNLFKMPGDHATCPLSRFEIEKDRIMTFRHMTLIKALLNSLQNREESGIKKQHTIMEHQYSIQFLMSEIQTLKWKNKELTEQILKIKQNKKQVEEIVLNKIKARRMINPQRQPRVVKLSPALQELKCDKSEQQLQEQFLKCSKYFCWQQLESATQLNIKQNILNWLPIKICSLKNLKKLDLQKCHIKQLPERIGELNLEQMNLSRNSLQKLPQSCKQMTNLKFLNVIFNQLQFIPNWIGDLKRIQKLQIGRNKIKQISEGLYRLINLKKLFLENNQIENISQQICQLKNLEQLHINNNKLKEIPNSIIKLTKLMFIHAQFNQITKLPENIQDMPLDFLNIGGNKLKQLPKMLLKQKTYFTLLIELSTEDIIQQFINMLNQIDDVKINKVSIQVFVLRQFAQKIRDYIFMHQSQKVIIQLKQYQKQFNSNQYILHNFYKFYNRHRKT